MRPTDRIQRILRLVYILWHKHPDLRLIQLLMVASANDGRDLFYIEDDEVEEGLKSMAKEMGVEL